MKFRHCLFSTFKKHCGSNPILFQIIIQLKVKRFKLLIEGAADLGDRKVFRRFPPVPTFILHIGKINWT